MIGETLRHYRIEAKLGAGGMGVVYRALDTHLDRPVAIKVLPASAVTNSDRRARFAQEAKSASALSHRNIITIYDIDTGQIEGKAVDYIAMQYVAGKTLDRMIGRTRVVNAGSIGMPFGDPGADWLLLDDGIQLRHTSYDFNKAADRIRQSGYPEADEFVARYLLNPPTEKAMLEAFSHAELR